jgi:SecD/SecF fusion protein
MNAEGAVIWERLTEDAYQNNSLIAIVVDGVVFSAPGVASGPIKGGRSQISGDFTLEEAWDLAGAVGSGAIPKMKILSYSSEPLQ